MKEENSGGKPAAETVLHQQTVQIRATLGHGGNGAITMECTDLNLKERNIFFKSGDIVIVRNEHVILFYFFIFWFSDFEVVIQVRILCPPSKRRTDRQTLTLIESWLPTYNGESFMF